MTYTVAYSLDIIPWAQITLSNPSGDGVVFLMTDKDGVSWEMEAVRQTDGSVRGFKVGEDCPYYESDGWTFALLHKNNYGEYAIMESWESAEDDFTFVFEFEEFGTNQPQEGKNYWDDIETTWESYFYKPGSGTENYGYLISSDEDFQRIEYYDVLGNLCIASFSNSTGIPTVNIRDPYGTCPFVEQGWTEEVLITDEDGIQTMNGPDGEPWQFYYNEDDFLEALYAAEPYDWYSVDFDSEPLYTGYLLDEDFESNQFYAVISTYD